MLKTAVVLPMPIAAEDVEILLAKAVVGEPLEEAVALVAEASEIGVVVALPVSVRPH